MRAAPGAASLVAAALALLLAPAPAGAEELDPAAFARLARQAVSDPAARERLMRVDTVGGVPVDVERALDGARGDELSQRLALLSGAPVGTAGNAAVARREARDVLSERRFRQTELPRPFRGVIAWLGDRIRPVVEWLGEVVPGGESTLWFVLGALVVLGAAIGSARIARRRSAAALLSAGRPKPAGRDPRPLERDAERAERAGDLELAIRLRFRAGLIRLDELKAIRFRDSLTSGEVARTLRSRVFDRVASSFDEVVYGRRTPDPDDARISREGWSQVLAEAAPR